MGVEVSRLVVVCFIDCNFLTFHISYHILPLVKYLVVVDSPNAVIESEFSQLYPVRDWFVGRGRVLAYMWFIHKVSSKPVMACQLGVNSVDDLRRINWEYRPDMYIVTTLNAKVRYFVKKFSDEEKDVKVLAVDFNDNNCKPIVDWVTNVKVPSRVDELVRYEEKLRRCASRLTMGEIREIVGKVLSNITKS